MSPTTTSTPPVAYPTVVIGGRTYTLKFNNLAEYLISHWGFDVGQVLEVIRPKSQDPHRIAYGVQLFAACVAHEFINAIPRQDPPTPEQWIQSIPEEQLPDAFAAVARAVVKRWADREIAKQAANPNPPTIETPAAPVQ